jgi:hypothetical protein
MKKTTLAFLAINFIIAGYFIFEALFQWHAGGFDSLACPVCWFGFVYRAYPASLLIFSGFLVFMALKVSPARAAPAALFAVGTFDWIGSWTGVIWGAPWWFVGIDSIDAIKFLSMTMLPLIAVNIWWRPPKLGLIALGLAFFITIGFQIAHIGTVLNTDIFPFSWEEGATEILFCAVGYFFFRPSKVIPAG